MSNHDRLRAVGIVWGCILIPLLVYGCAARPVRGDPDTLTRSWFEQGWSGTEDMRIVERPLLDPQQDCHGNTVACAQYDPATKTCTIWLTDAVREGKRVREHEEMHCADAHLRVRDGTHKLAADRARVARIVRDY